MNIAHREDFVSAGLTCVTGMAWVPAITKFSFLPLAAWIGGFVVWVAMKARSGK